MSAILSSWLKDELRLSHPRSASWDLDASFQNGYLFGQLLRRLDVCSAEFDSQFTNSKTMEASIANFTVIERILRDKLGIKLSPNAAFDLITAKPGSAARLLYQIKACTGSVTVATRGAPSPASPERDRPAVVRRISLPPLGRAATGAAAAAPTKKKTAAPPRDEDTGEAGEFESYPGTPTGHRTPNPDQVSSESPKRRYMEKEHEFFADTLKAKLRRSHRAGYKALDHPRLQHPEVDYDKLLLLRKHEKEAALRLSPNAAAAKRAERESPHEKHFAEAVEPASSKKPRKVTESSKAAPKRTDQRNEEPQKKKQKEVNRIASAEPHNRMLSRNDSLDDFDVAEPDPADVKRFLAHKAGMDPVQHIGVLAKQLLPSDEALKKSKDYVDRIREKRAEEEDSRKEREQWQRKVILGQQNAQEAVQKSHLEDLLLSKLMRQSKQERRIAEGLMQIRHQKEVMRQNRIFREEQYSKRRQKDYEEALEREFALAERRREEYKRQTALQLSQHLEILARKAEAKHAKNSDLCRDIVYQIVDLSVRISEYATLNDQCELPKNLLREWKTLFVQGKLLAGRYDIEVTADQMAAGDDDELAEQNPGDAMESSAAEAVKLLDEQEFLDYIQGTGSWPVSTDSGKPLVNELLGSVVSNILEIVYPQEAAPEVSQVPSVPLKLCIIGKAFAGKSTLAKALSSHFGLTVIDPDVLLKEHMSQHENSEKEAKTQDHSKRQSSSKVLMEGAAIDDEAIVNLVAAAVRKISEKSAATGWIILNFPRNRQQAQLFEKELSGYEDPKPVKLGNLKRTPKEKDKQQRRSLIAPASDQKGEAKLPVAISGIDVLALLDVENEVAIKRAAGRRVDPITGIEYHLEFNPPPDNLPGIYDRLVPVTDEGNQIAQLQFQLASFEEQEELMKDWFARFGNLQIVDSNASPQNTFEVMCDTLKEVITRKEKERDEKAQEERERVDKEKTREEGVSPADEAVVVSIPEPFGAASLDSGNDKKSAAGKGAEDDKKAKGATASARARVPSAKATEKVPPRVPSATGDPKQTPKAATAAETPISAKKAPTAASSAGGKVGETSTMDMVVDIPQPTIVRTSLSDGRKLPSKELAEILADQWATIEKSYTDAIKFGFRCLRRERELILRYFHNTKVNFRKCLERPDRKQQLLELFQLEFNSIEDDLRCDPEAKGELHQRAEDLREKLWDMSDMRREEAESERLAVVEDKWIEDHCAIISNIHISMIQAEIDRFIMTKNLVHDFFRDAYGANILSESIKLPPRLTLLNALSAPPFDISAIITSTTAADLLHRNRRDVNSAGDSRISGKSGRLSTQANKKLSLAGLPKNAVAPNSAAPSGGGAPPASVNSGAVGEPAKDQSSQDQDLALVSDVEAAVSVALAALVTPHEEVIVMEKDKKDKKKGGLPEPTEIKVVEPEADIPPECFKMLEVEESILSQRLDRLKSHALETLKDLKAKGIEVYNLLDEWIGLRFQNEMDAIREMLNLIKEAVEMEVKLPNELILEGEKFKVDFTILTLEPDQEPRPESPVEKPQADQFTVLQLVNVSRHLREISPSGLIAAKEFVESLQKLTALTPGMDILPESYMMTDYSQLQQIIQTLDPHETGFINWRKYVILNARIPILTFEQISSLKSSYVKSGSFVDGKIKKSDFLKVPLWPEEDGDDLSGNAEESPARFNRSAKLKAALAYIFSVPDESASRGKLPSSARNEGNAGSGGASSDARNEESFSGAEAVTGRTGFAEEESTFEKQEVLQAVEGQGPSGEDTAEFGAPGGMKFLGDHDEIPDDGSMFDAVNFLMCCCLDEFPKVGLQKAIMVLSDREDGAVTMHQLYQIFHYGLVVADDTNRLGIDQSEDPAPMENLLKVFEDAGINPDDYITFEAFSALQDAQSFLSSPLFLTHNPKFTAERDTFHKLSQEPASCAGGHGRSRLIGRVRQVRWA
ncbi:hypothetical protein DFJ73DRAFT_824011 [Zopfochytrium polystomum]|nr:hypothetical protein DFJ73DRAFT_824011 [Zopfochytrium polystomum]